MSVIEIEHLKKQYGTQTVLDDITVNFDGSGIYGIIGRNGSGKTMLLKAICGLVKPTSGFVRVDGKVIGKDIDTPESIGVIIESPGYLPDSSAYQNLRILARLKNRISGERIIQTLKTAGLDPASRKPVGRYSLGMKQRLGLAQALMEDPELLVLDEPMNGLDNEGAAQIRELLLEQKRMGKTILLASHSREDIQILCDEVYLMNRGALTRYREVPVQSSI